MSPVARVLPNSHVATLHVLLKGGSIDAVRRFPFPHVFHLILETGMRSTVPLPPKQVSDLLVGGYLRVAQTSKSHDTIRYYISDKGADMAAAGGVEKLPKQPTIFDVVGGIDVAAPKKKKPRRMD